MSSTGGPATVAAGPGWWGDRVPVVPPQVASLDPWVAAGVLGSSDVQVAAAVARLLPGCGPLEILAVALAARAPRFGHVGLDLADLTGERPVVVDVDPGSPLVWPTREAWRATLASSPAVATAATARTEPFRPLVWDHGRLYLQRYWCDEVEVARVLSERAGRVVGPAVDGRSTREVLDLLFGPSGTSGSPPEADGSADAQRLAAQRGLERGVSIVAGGPGTGKTHTVARLLVAFWLMAGAPADDRDRVALVAPTGKAANRMAEAVSAQLDSLRRSGVLPPDGSGPTVDAGTVHRLLGPLGRHRFRHDADHPLPHELVVVDETSMVSLPLMASLIDALGPGARLVLVGDPFQLASIEAGSVMRDLVGPAGGSDEDRDTPPVGGEDRSAHPLAGGVTVLSSGHRFGPESGIAELAAAVRHGDVGRVLSVLGQGRPDVAWVDPADPVAVDRIAEQAATAGEEQVECALAGDAEGALAAARTIKVLAATRRGPSSVEAWTDRLEQKVAAAASGFQPRRTWHAGRPVIVTANDAGLQVFNGDTGVVVTTPDGLQVAMADGGSVRWLAPSRLDQVETWWAMTIHKSQGSEYPTVVVSLPPAPSPILTRELLYTAVTRAREQLVVVADEASLRAAVARPLARASGLRDRLWPGSAGRSEGTDT